MADKGQNSQREIIRKHKKGEVERGNWSKKLDFILSCVGYAVGLGNVWRFPYLCYRNGGGAFLIPYVIMLVLCGLPIFFFELSFGQFASQGPITIWRVNPLFRGIGYAMVAISTMVCTYYNVIIAYAFYYLLVAFVNLDGDVPWATCGNVWNTDQCISGARPDITNLNDTGKAEATMNFMNESCVNNTLRKYGLEREQVSYDFAKENMTNCAIKYHTASEEYFTNFVLRLNEVEDFSDIGNISLKLALSNALAWIVVFFSLRKGVKSSGKVVYFTATFPYVVLLILLVRGVTLDGYWKGIEFYVIPKWEKLLEAKVWGDAASQIFYSLGPAFGSLITMASYNKFKNNCHRDAIIVAIINCGTSIFAGFVIFAVLGFMAHVTNQDVDKVADSGPGLVFVAYPEGLSRMPVAPVWSVLFFTMLITLGLDSQFAMMEAVISAISDEFPHFLRRHKSYFTLFCCMALFLLGLPLVTKGGIWILTLMDWYTASYSLMIVSLCELIAVNWIYGFRNFCADIELMIGFQPNPYWKITWVIITPIIIVFILIVSSIQNRNAYYGSYEFEDWVQGIGWAMVGLPLFLIIFAMFVQLIRYKSLYAVVKPDPKWGPSKEEHRLGKYAQRKPIHVDRVNGEFPDTLKSSPYYAENDPKKMFYNDAYHYDGPSTREMDQPPKYGSVNYGYDTGKDYSEISTHL